MLLGLGGCDDRSATKEFDRQIEACSVAEGKRLLEPAVEACDAALAIADAPLVVDLSGDERKAAANVFRGFSVRLDRMGHTAQAQYFKAKAQELAGS